jgi:uncharacterized protein YndB with AHSA1/START domain
MAQEKFETIRQTAVIDGTPNEVFEAHVDPRKHSEFICSPATGSLKVRGRFTARDGYIKGRFLELKKGKKVVRE